MKWLRLLKRWLVSRLRPPEASAPSFGQLTSPAGLGLPALAVPFGASGRADDYPIPALPPHYGGKVAVGYSDTHFVIGVLVRESEDVWKFVPQGYFVRRPKKA